MTETVSRPSTAFFSIERELFPTCDGKSDEPLSPWVFTYGLRPAADPRISPDGKDIVYTESRTDQTSGKTTTHLWLLRSDGSDARQLTQSGTKNTAPRWSPDGQAIAFVSDRGDREGRTSGLYLLPSAGGEARLITRHGNTILSPEWSADGNAIAYAVLVNPDNPDETPRPDDAPPPVRVTRRLDYKQDVRGYLGDARLHVFVVDVQTGTRRQVTSDAVDHLEPRWSPDGRSLAIKLIGENTFSSQLGLIDLASGAIKRIGPEGGMVAVWAWSPDGSHIILAGDDRQTWQTDFFRYDVAIGDIHRLTDDLQCLPDAGYPAIAPPTHPVWLDDRTLLFSAIRGGASGLYTLDSHSGDVHATHRWQATHGGLSVDASGRYVVQTHSGLEATGEIILTDRETGETRQLTNQNGDIFANHSPADWEHFIIERGDLEIDGWLLFPTDFDPTKRYPVILDVHGGPHSWYGYTMSPTQQVLATNGYLVVFSNPRGSGSYGRDFAQRVITDWGGEDYLDLMAIFDHVLERPYADPRRTGILGYSYGGYMTAWTIGQTDRFQAAVCGAPCFDLESMYGTSDIGHSFGDMQWGTQPHLGQEWYRAHSPSEFAHRATTPTLIVHGEADERCPIGQGEQMFIALKKAECEVEFVRYPGGSHLFLRLGPPAHREDYLGRVLGWFQDHLGTNAS